MKFYKRTNATTKEKLNILEVDECELELYDKNNTTHNEHIKKLGSIDNINVLKNIFWSLDKIIPAEGIIDKALFYKTNCIIVNNTIDIPIVPVYNTHIPRYGEYIDNIYWTYKTEYNAIDQIEQSINNNVAYDYTDIAKIIESYLKPKLQWDLNGNLIDIPDRILQTHTMPIMNMPYTIVSILVTNNTADPIKLHYSTWHLNNELFAIQIRNKNALRHPDGIIWNGWFAVKRK